MTEARHPWDLLRLAKETVAFLSSLTVQGSVAITSGFLCVGLGAIAGASWSNKTLLLLIGMGVTAWPMRIYNSPENILERLFKRWDRWAKANIITMAECRAYKKELKAWYRSERKRRFPRAFATLNEEAPMFDALVEDHDA